MNMLISRLINPAEINAILPQSRTSIEYLYYQQLLEDIARNNNLQSILIISPEYDVLVSAPEILADQSYLNLHSSQAFKTALNGLPAVSDIQSYSGEKFMSAFTPIQNIDGYTIAVISIEAKANYFEIISSLRHRLLLFSLINSALIILIAFFLSIMIRRSLQYQAEIKEQERLVELGTMAATVAHELRNPLNIIEATNDVIQKKYAKTNDEVFSFIPDEVKRLSVLIDNFLKFARNPELKIESKPVSQLIDRIKLNLTDQEMNRLQIVYPESDIVLKTDHSLVEQVVLNPLKNAFEACKPDETVQVKFEKIHGKNLKITVEDEGPGIPSEIMGKIFEPFFTTKEKGTGLGLAITKRIIDKLDGNISIHSDSGEGTQIEIKLPIISI